MSIVIKSLNDRIEVLREQEVKFNGYITKNKDELKELIGGRAIVLDEISQIQDALDKLK